jgi:DNA-directed RNA polymerase subunit beta'
MVLGCYYLTAENPEVQKGDGQYFSSLDDVIKAYHQKEVELHSQIWVRYLGEVMTDKPDDEIISQETLEDKSVAKVYRERRVREDANGQLISQFIKTTPGRVIYNKTIQETIAL